MAKLQVGIIGCGQIATMHAKCYQNNDRARIAAVCDIREELVIERALEWEASKYYLDYRELLADPDIDAVAILTPNHLHARMAYDAIREGKHVSMQAPLCLSLPESDTLVAESTKHAVVLKVTEALFFFQPLLDLNAYLSQGEIGRTISQSYRTHIGSPDGGWEIKPESWLWRFDPQKAGGGPFLFDEVYHKLAVATLLAGRISHVQAWVERTEIVPGYYVDAPSVIYWKHQNPAVIGSLAVTYSPKLLLPSKYYPNDTRAEITGESGIFSVSLSPANLSTDSPLSMFRDGRHFQFGEVEASWDKAFVASTENFINAIHGMEKPIMTGEEAREILRLTLAVHQSAQTGRAQQVA